jgi:hypothetical protein
MAQLELEMQLLKSLKPRGEHQLTAVYQLPCQRIAFVYQRQSGYEQKVKHIWSQKNQDRLAEMARVEGYPEEFIIVEKRDLGVSGAKTEEKREGLRYLISLMKEKRVESLWVVELSRLYRDMDFVHADKLALLLREHQVIVVTLERRYNLNMDTDWADFHAEMVSVVRDTQFRAKKFRDSRREKAEAGFWSGFPIVPGFIVAKQEGRDTYDVLLAYEPHRLVVEKIYKAYVRAGFSGQKAAEALKGIVFPAFPKELSYMETRSSLRRSPRTANGDYIITPRLIRSLIGNCVYIGWWPYDREGNPDRFHHEPLIEPPLFWEAYRGKMEHKPRGKAAGLEPLPSAGLLWCQNHPEERRVSADNARGRYACEQDYQQGQGPICFDKDADLIDTPVLEAIFRRLDFTFCVEKVLTKLEKELVDGRAEEKERARRRAELARKLANLEGQLADIDPKEKERLEIQWRLISQVRSDLKALEEPSITQPQITNTDVATVREFLTNLAQYWTSLSPTTRNRFLKILLEKETVSHDEGHIYITIHWRSGLKQRIVVCTDMTPRRERVWQPEETDLLRALWPSASREVLLAALPGKTWKAIAGRAQRMGLRRQRIYRPVENWRPWAEEEDAKLAELCSAGVPLSQIAVQLGRSFQSVATRVSLKQLERPAAPRRARKRYTWYEEPPSPEPLQELSIPRGEGGSSFKRGRSPLFFIPPPRLPGEGE